MRPRAMIRDTDFVQDAVIIVEMLLMNDDAGNGSATTSGFQILDNAIRDKSMRLGLCISSGASWGEFP